MFAGMLALVTCYTADSAISTDSETGVLQSRHNVWFSDNNLVRVRLTESRWNISHLHLVTSTANIYCLRLYVWMICKFVSVKYLIMAYFAAYRTPHWRLLSLQPAAARVVNNFFALWNPKFNFLVDKSSLLTLKPHSPSNTITIIKRRIIK